MNEHPLQTEILQRARRVKLLVLDVDGVLTDGKLYFSNAGDELKAFHILDGHGIKLLQKSGVKVALITGRQSDLVGRRARDLGIDLLFQNREDKLRALDIIREELRLNYEEIAYLGDDLPDLPCILRAGLGVTVPNAYQRVKEETRFITTSCGGEGAVREVCDWILRAQGNYDDAIAAYSPPL